MIMYLYSLLLAVYFTIPIDCVLDLLVGATYPNH